MSQRVRAYHLPPIGEAITTEVRVLNGVEVELPCLHPAQLQRAIEAVRAAATERLRSRSVDDVLVAIDRVVTNWLRPDYHLRHVAEATLPLVTGFSAEMIRHGLPLLLAPLRAEAVRALLTAELGDYRLLDGIDASRTACGPGLIAHVLSGNIPGLGAAPMLLSLAVKSAVLVKSAAGDPIFPALLAQSIAEVDEHLGACLLVAHWRGGDRALEDVAYPAADLLVASGSDVAVVAIASQACGRFIGHGHKISFAAIGREGLSDDAAAQRLASRLAYDVALWDQQGCLSPQLCYVERDAAITPLRFAEFLGEALSRVAQELPPRQLSLDERAAILRFRQEAEWGQGGKTVLLASVDSTAWSVSVEVDAEFVPSCLNRCIRVKVIGSLSELPGALAPHRRHLEAVGAAVGTDRLPVVAEMFARCGVHRICPIGAMQVPPLSWRQGGRPRVADWVEWSSVEDAKREAVCSTTTT